MSDLTLEQLVLKEAASGNFGALGVATLELTGFIAKGKCHNDGFVVFLANINPRSGGCHKGVLTTNLLPQMGSSGHAVMADMAIAEAQPCGKALADTGTTDVLHSYSDVKSLKYRYSSGRKDRYDGATDNVFVYVPSSAIISRLTTSRIIVRTMAGLKNKKHYGRTQQRMSSHLD